HAPGLHNVRNALAAVGVGLELDVPFPAIAAALAQYTGVDRRFQVKGEAGGILLVDDYAHHPTEVAATLAAAAKGWPERRVVAVFHPRPCSRTRDLADAFARAFYAADVLVLTDIYGAREEPIAGVDGQLLVDLARRYGHRDVHYVGAKAELPASRVGLTRPGDLGRPMGAGDVARYGQRLVGALPHGGRRRGRRAVPRRPHEPGGPLMPTPRKQQGRRFRRLVVGAGVLTVAALAAAAWHWQRALPLERVAVRGFVRADSAEVVRLAALPDSAAL